MRTKDTKQRYGKASRKTRRGKSAARPISTAREMAIDQLGRHGAGIVEGDNGSRVYVPFTLPGEKVLARVSGDRGQLTEILEPSPERIRPLCQHFGICGGCSLQHAKTGFIKDWKHQIIETALANRRIEAQTGPVIDAHGAGRRRVTLHVRSTRGRFQAGFIRPRSHELETIETCPVLAPPLASAPDLAIAVVEPLKAYGSAFKVAMTATDGGLDIAISGRGTEPATDDLDIRQAFADLAERHDLARLALGGEGRVGGETIVARRPAALTMGPAHVDLPPNSFTQATSLGEQTLARLVVEAVGNAKRIADLFSGLGPFALRLASTCAVHTIDNDAPALKALAAAANHAGIRSVTTETRDLFRRPLLGPELTSFDAVIFDPPRAGAEAQAKALAASKVPVVVAVSCEPATFARDAGCLVAGGYTLESVTPVDQFKWSSHIEIVGVFRR